MADHIDIKRGNLLPTLRATLRDASGAVVDLTNAESITFRMREKGLVLSEETKVDAEAAALGDPTLGRVEYTWVLGDTDTVGLYAGEWVVVFLDDAEVPNELPMTFPNEDFVYIRVNPDLGD